jgi:tRNA threonylcarbamoyladenosine biosynthesis protein TsaB
VGTLQAMVAGYISEHGAPSADTIFCPMIDARRMEVYAALYDSQLTELKPPTPWILTEENIIAGFLGKHKVICFGNGALKGTEILQSSQVAIDVNTYLNALNLVSIADKKYTQQEFEAIAYFEPIYLKTTPVKQP